MLPGYCRDISNRSPVIRPKSDRILIQRPDSLLVLWVTSAHDCAHDEDRDTTARNSSFAHSSISSLTGLSVAAIITFEWDPDKASSNQEKHSVSVSEAASVFSDPLSLTIFDPDHSVDEDRFLLLGLSAFQRLLVVGHTGRSDTIRIINARAAYRKERLRYKSKH